MGDISLHKRIVEVYDELCEYDSNVKNQHERGIIKRVDEKNEEGERKHQRWVYDCCNIQDGAPCDNS